ncbi:MAG: NlpC/P60 family protein [Christensenellaceae bacterium]
MKKKNVIVSLFLTMALTGCSSVPPPQEDYEAGVTLPELSVSPPSLTEPPSASEPSEPSDSPDSPDDSEAIGDSVEETEEEIEENEENEASSVPPVEPAETIPTNPTAKPPTETAPSVEETVPTVRKKTYLSVNASNLHVRSGAGTGYSSLGTVQKGEYLAYYGKSGDWMETRYLGKVAFVSASYVKKVEMVEGSERVEKVIALAETLLGTPYVYGAVRLHDGEGNFLKNFTTSKFDCSSLTQYVWYYGANVLLGTTTRTQVLQGKKVTKSGLERGDLMFFTNSSRVNKTGIERIGHVAIWLGDNRILHTSSDYAKIEEVSAARWAYFIEGRRV